MSDLPKLRHTVDRFNQGCSFFQKAIDSWKNGDMHGYETALRKAATEAIGALEWTLKIYLRFICNDKVISDDRSKLKHPNFDVLMTLMKKYSEPSLTNDDSNLLYAYRDMFRNAAEHDASIPPSQDLCNAIQKIRSIMSTYLPVQEEDLRTPSLVLTPEGVIQGLKSEYFQTLQSRYEYMDLGGISPRVGSRVIKIRMKDLFVPLRAREGSALFESFLEEYDPTESSELDDKMVIQNNNPSPEIDDPDLEELSYARHHLGMPRLIEIDSILKNRKSVVLGDPGSGKTTVGKYIAYSIATERIESVGKHLEHHIPVIVKAAEYATSMKTNSTLSFYDYVVQKHTSKFGELFRWALQSGLCLVIIDGLDEIHDTHSRVTTSRRIEGFVSEFQRNRFLITSRIVGYRQNQLTGDFVHFMLSELNEIQALQFLVQWYKAIESETVLPINEDEIKQRALNLWEAIESKPGISKLAGNPLLLTIIALANWRGTKLPNRRVELYQIATETLVENWPLKQRGVALDSEEILEILEPIAYQIFSSGKNNLITERDLRPLFESQVREMHGISPIEAKTLGREILHTIELDTGFFIAKGFDQYNHTLYGFLHLTFAEYLTACFMAEQWSRGQLDLQKYAHDDRWHEVLLLLAGHIGTWAKAQATKLVKDILDLKSPYEEYLHRDLLLAAEILGDNVRITRKIQDEIVSKLLYLALHTPHVNLWGSVVNHLSNIAKIFQLGEPASQLQFCRSDSLEMLVRKAVLLTMIGEAVTDETLRILLQGLSTIEEISRLITPFLDTVSVFNQSDDATHLLVIQTGASAHIFRISKQTAGKITRLDLPIYDVDSLHKRPPSVSKGACIWLLDPAEIIALDSSTMISLFAEDRWPVRFLLATTPEIQDSYISIFNDLVELVFSGNSNENRVSILDFLYFLLTAMSFRGRDENILQRINSIQPLVTSNDSPDIRAKALRIIFLSRNNLESKFEILDQALNDSDATVRLTAVMIVSQSQYGIQLPDSIFAKLKLLLEDVSLDVRRNSAHALIRTGKFEEEDIKILLEAGLKQPIESIDGRDMDTWLINLLLLTNKARLQETLDLIILRIIEFLKARTTTDMQETFYWYSFWGEQELRHQKELAEAVSCLFDNSDSEIRYAAVCVWSRIRSKTTTSGKLVRLLKDNASNVKVAAIKALDSIDFENQEIIHVLLCCLVNMDLKIANATVSALSRIREPKLRQDVIDQVVILIAQKPENERVYEVLWNLVSPNTSWSDDIPF